MKMTVLLAHHNLPIATMDHLSPLLGDIFPDSKIAKGFASARTKTSCIINGALRPYFEKCLVEKMTQSPFSLAIDGSNDKGLDKMNPLTVRVFDRDAGRVTTMFLDMCLTSGTHSATAESIFSSLDTALQSRGISWNNCVGVSMDNTSVNMGRRNSIKSRAVVKNPNVYIMGCPCHIVHNCAHKASEAFQQV